MRCPSALRTMLLSGRGVTNGRPPPPVQSVGFAVFGACPALVIGLLSLTRHADAERGRRLTPVRSAESAQHLFPPAAGFSVSLWQGAADPSEASPLLERPNARAMLWRVKLEIPARKE